MEFESNFSKTAEGTSTSNNALQDAHAQGSSDPS